MSAALAAFRALAAQAAGSPWIILMLAVGALALWVAFRAEAADRRAQAHLRRALANRHPRDASGRWQHWPEPTHRSRTDQHM